MSYSHNQKKFVEIVVPLAIENTLTYAIPTDCNKKIRVGSRAVVPFRRRLAVGIIESIHTEIPSYPVQEILAIPDDTWFFTGPQVNLIQWIHKYYLAPIGNVVRMAIESRKSYFKTQLREINPITWEAFDAQLATFTEITFDDLCKHVGYEEAIIILTQLVKSNSLLLTPLLTRSYLLEQVKQEQGKREQTSYIHLSSEMKVAVNLISTLVKRKKNSYLNRGTQEEQSQVYKALAAQVMEQGGQVLYLSPRKEMIQEIVKDLKKKWGERVKGYHSGVTSSKKQKIAEGVADHTIHCVVGRPGALFLPFAGLKLIIISEAEDVAYKQIGKAPRYHGRDTALMFGNYASIPVVLGDTTPSLESYSNIQKSKYQEVTLPQHSQRSSHLRLVGLGSRQEFHPKRDMIAPAMWKLIDDARANCRPIVIIHSRRGYANYYGCGSCGWIARCPECEVSFTYHQATPTLLCHYCKKKQNLLPTCLSCKSESLKQYGMGIEQVEELFRFHYPETSLVRLDIDSLSSPTQYQKVIKQWHQNQIAMLLSTPRIIRYLPATDNSLAILLGMDEPLKSSNFRVHEQLFCDLVSIQAQGYDLLLQTASQGLRRIAYQANEKDLTSFYEDVLADRKMVGYPPFRRLVSIMLIQKEKPVSDIIAQELIHLLKRYFNYPCLGPHQSTPVVGQKGIPISIWVLLPLEGLAAAKKRVHRFIAQWNNKPTTKVKVIWDVDPL